ncbi:MAG: hypothetical protein AUK63_1489 [bacterium P3]|nr:MAG: hypothetical protein AUK63_1489 [bacterium P3]KWW40017.1 MAG: hypothetical protein F083_1739 [bacterium F083]
MKKSRIILLGVALLSLGMSSRAQLPDWGCDSETQQQMLEHVSLYQESMKQYDASKDARYCEEAYPHWQLIVANCPKQSQNLYVRGPVILKNKMNKAATAAERDSLINELMRMYDIRIANYGDPANTLGKKALDLETLRGASGVGDYYPVYAQAAGHGNLQPAYVVKFMEATIKYVQAGLAEPTLVVDNYDIASEMLENALDAQAADSNKANLIRRYISGVESAFAPYADCGQLVEIYAKKFASDPENVALLKKITNIMMKKGCTDAPLFFQATENLYRLEPSATTAMRMGQMCVSKKEYSTAVKYLTDAANDLESPKDRYKACILLGVAQAGQGSYAAARSAFYRAAEADPTKGEPYLQIASLYMSHHSNDDGMSGRSAYWAACDKAVRAKNIDPSIADEANKIINRCTAAFPKKEDAFMLNLMNGQSYVVGGWIGESTTVRTR